MNDPTTLSASNENNNTHVSSSPSPTDPSSSDVVDPALPKGSISDVKPFKVQGAASTMADDDGLSVKKQQASFVADSAHTHTDTQTYTHAGGSTSLITRSARTSNAFFVFLERQKVPPWLVMCLAVALPVIGLLVFAAMFVATATSNVADNNWVQDYVPLVTPLLSAVHEAQKERGLTGRYMSPWVLPSDNATLQKQRGLTTEAWRAADLALRLLPMELREIPLVVEASSGVKSLDIVRELIETGDNNPWDIFSFYTNQIYKFLGTVGAMAEHCPVEKTSRLLGQLLTLSSMKEYMGQTRGLGMIVIRDATNVSVLFKPTKNNDLLPVYAMEQVVALERAFLGSAARARVNLYKSIVAATPEFQQMRDTVETLRFGGNLAGGNATVWWGITTKAIGALVQMERSMINEFVDDAGSAQEAATSAMAGIVVAVFVAVVPAGLVVVVTRRTHMDLSTEQANTQELEHAIARVTPVELLVSLQVDVRTLQPGVRQTIAASLVSVQCNNMVDVARVDGDEHLLRAFEKLYVSGVVAARDGEGYVMNLTSEGFVMVMPSKDAALNAAFQLQMGLVQVNLDRSVVGSPVQLGASIVAHSGTVTVGVVGVAELRLDCVLISSTTVFLKALHRLANATGARFLTTDAVLEDVATDTLLMRRIGRVADYHHGEPHYHVVHEVFNLDPQPMRDLKCRTASLISKIAYPVRNVSAARAREVIAALKAAARDSLSRECAANKDSTLSMKSDLATELGAAANHNNNNNKNSNPQNNCHRPLRCQIFKDK
eukprot:PhM_4_TR17018/c0_g1_i1/m.99391